LDSLTDRSLKSWIEALSHSVPVPAGGALALVTLAGSAALAAKVARIAGNGPGLYDRWAWGFLEAAQQDGEAYLAARHGTVADVRGCLALTTEHLEQAVELLESLAPLFEGLSPALKADAAAAERAARASACTLLVNLAVNLSQWTDEYPDLGESASNLAALKARLESV
jgi:formiminotetrahydrofolate cyclodeaminase